MPLLHLCAQLLDAHLQVLPQLLTQRVQHVVGLA